MKPHPTGEGREDQARQLLAQILPKINRPGIKISVAVANGHDAQPGPFVVKFYDQTGPRVWLWALDEARRFRVTETREPGPPEREPFDYPQGHPPGEAFNRALSFALFRFTEITKHTQPAPREVPEIDPEDVPRKHYRPARMIGKF